MITATLDRSSPPEASSDGNEDYKDPGIPPVAIDIDVIEVSVGLTEIETVMVTVTLPRVTTDIDVVDGTVGLTETVVVTATLPTDVADDENEDDGDKKAEDSHDKDEGSIGDDIVIISPDTTTTEAPDTTAPPSTAIIPGRPGSRYTTTDEPAPSALPGSPPRAPFLGPTTLVTSTRSSKSVPTSSSSSSSDSRTKSKQTSTSTSSTSSSTKSIRPMPTSVPERGKAHKDALIIGLSTGLGALTIFAAIATGIAIKGSTGLGATLVSMLKPLGTTPSKILGKILPKLVGKEISRTTAEIFKEWIELSKVKSALSNVPTEWRNPPSPDVSLNEVFAPENIEEMLNQIPSGSLGDSAPLPENPPSGTPPPEGSGEDPSGREYSQDPEGEHSEDPSGGEGGSDPSGSEYSQDPEGEHSEGPSGGEGGSDPSGEKGKGPSGGGGGSGSDPSGGQGKDPSGGGGGGGSNPSGGGGGSDPPGGQGKDPSEGEGEGDAKEDGQEDGQENGEGDDKGDGDGDDKGSKAKAYHPDTPSSIPAKDDPFPPRDEGYESTRRTNEVSEARDKMAQCKYLRDFPSGMAVLNTPATDFQCAFYAIGKSIKAQFPGVRVPKVSELLQLHRKIRKENHIDIPGVETGNDNWLGEDQMTAVAKRYMKTQGKNIDLGTIKRYDGYKRFPQVLDRDNADAPLSEVLWVHYKEDERHWEGIGHLKPDRFMRERVQQLLDALQCTEQRNPPNTGNPGPTGHASMTRPPNPQKTGQPSPSDSDDERRKEKEEQERQNRERREREEREKKEREEREKQEREEEERKEKEEQERWERWERKRIQHNAFSMLPKTMCRYSHSRTNWFVYVRDWNACTAFEEAARRIAWESNDSWHCINAKSYTETGEVVKGSEEAVMISFLLDKAPKWTITDIMRLAGGPTVDCVKWHYTPRNEELLRNELGNEKIRQAFDGFPDCPGEKRCPGDPIGW